MISIANVKEDIYNYYINQVTKHELIEQRIINPKMSQTLTNMPKGSGVATDCVSREVERLMELDERIKKLDSRIKYIDDAMKELDDFEKKVIEYIKQGYKMGMIGSLLNCSKYRVINARDTGIEKICNYANRMYMCV